MTIEHYNWCQEHKGILYHNNTVDKEKKAKLYEIYNAATQENKRPNGCGKCLTTTVNRVRFELEKYEASNERKRI